MRIITMFFGVLMAVLGIFSFANEGLSFISMAFPIGVVLTVVGIIECFSYKKANETEENKHWILIDGLTTFVLGIVVLTGQLAAEAAVTVVFGMWSMITGIREFVANIIIAERPDKDFGFYWDAGVGVLNLAIGVYTFFNAALFQLSVLTILGLCFIFQGGNVIKLGLDIPYIKPDLIKTKEEKVADATEQAEKAHAEAQEAIQKAIDAVNKIQEVKEEHVVAEIVNGDEPVNGGGTDNEE